MNIKEFLDHALQGNCNDYTGIVLRNTSGDELFDVGKAEVLLLENDKGKQVSVLCLTPRSIGMVFHEIYSNTRF
jgi:hypothetical protein